MSNCCRTVSCAPFGKRKRAQMTTCDVLVPSFEATFSLSWQFAIEHWPTTWATGNRVILSWCWTPPPVNEATTSEAKARDLSIDTLYLSYWKLGEKEEIEAAKATRDWLVHRTAWIALLSLGHSRTWPSLGPVRLIEPGLHLLRREYNNCNCTTAIVPHFCRQTVITRSDLGLDSTANTLLKVTLHLAGSHRGETQQTSTKQCPNCTTAFARSIRWVILMIASWFHLLDPSLGKDF